MSQPREQFTGILNPAWLTAEQTEEQDFALIVNAPSEIAQALDDVRRRYDPAFKVGIPPHITIKRPAPLGGADKLAQLQAVLREGLTGAGEVSVQLRGYGIFKNPGTSVVFVKVQDEQPLLDLHQRSLTALSQIYPNGQADHFEGEKYHPHLTIGNELSELDLAVLEHELATGGYQLDFAFTVDCVTLFISQSGKPWQAIEDFKFTPSTAHE